jgi:hypothetical protein
VLKYRNQTRYVGALADKMVPANCYFCLSPMWVLPTETDSTLIKKLDLNHWILITGKYLFLEYVL